jgi:hypothetical protein
MNYLAPRRAVPTESRAMRHGRGTQFKNRAIKRSGTCTKVPNLLSKNT